MFSIPFTHKLSKIIKNLKEKEKDHLISEIYFWFTSNHINKGFS